MEAAGQGAPIEPELLGPLPRRVRWRRARWRLWVRLLLAGPLTLLLLWPLASEAWLLVLALLGSATQARIVAREGSLRGYSVTLEYPLRGWSGVDHPVREVRVLDQTLWGALVRTEAVHATRLGRGPLQVIRIALDEPPPDAFSLLLEIGLGLGPLVAAALLLLWGRLARDFWLVRWGRAVPGCVREGTSRPFYHFYRLAYEYREMEGPAATATLRARMAVSQCQFEESPAGRPLAVLHGLWNPRWSVAYPFARFAAVAREEPESP